MFKYQVRMKNDKGQTIQVYTGEVSDEGSVALDILKECAGGFMVIEWEPIEKAKD
jgi:hypothetical protein